MPIASESPDQPEVVALVAETDTYLDTLYLNAAACAGLLRRSARA